MSAHKFNHEENNLEAQTLLTNSSNHWNMSDDNTVQALPETRTEEASRALTLTLRVNLQIGDTAGHCLVRMWAKIVNKILVGWILHLVKCSLYQNRGHLILVNRSGTWKELMTWHHPVGNKAVSHVVISTDNPNTPWKSSASSRVKSP